MSKRTCPSCGLTWHEDGDDSALRARLIETEREVRRLTDALADLYCARLREGWEGGTTEDDAANTAVHLCANNGVNVFERLERWRNP